MIRVALVGADNTPGPFGPVIIRTRSRNMAVDGLEPGSQFMFQVRAVGGLNGFSDWSDVQVQRVM